MWGKCGLMCGCIGRIGYCGLIRGCYLGYWVLGGRLVEGGLLYGLNSALKSLVVVDSCGLF